MQRLTDPYSQLKELINNNAAVFGYSSGFEFRSVSMKPGNINIQYAIERLKRLQKNTRKQNSHLSNADFLNIVAAVGGVEVLAEKFNFTAVDASAAISLAITLTFSADTTVYIDYGNGTKLYLTTLAGAISVTQALSQTDTHVVSIQFKDATLLTGATIKGKVSSISTLAAEVNLKQLDLSTNKLAVVNVNAILVSLDANGKTAGTVNLTQSPAAVPTGAGATAKTSLQGKTWTVTTN